MKKTYILSILISLSASGFTQGLTEIVGINIYEHHFSGCGPCAPSNLGDSSAYDFVTHQHINSVSPAFDANRDMVEHNGDPSGPAPFGFTSDTSSVWAGQFGGNGTTKFYLAAGFDYNNATQWSVVNAYNNTSAYVEVNSVQLGEVYIAKVRNLEYYVVLKITAFQTNTDNDFTFNYKYTDNPISSASISENNQDASLIIYPNPANNIMNIQFNETHQDISISIRNIHGSEVLFEQFNNQNLINLSLSNLPNGIYFISAQIDNKLERQLFIKEE